MMRIWTVPMKGKGWEVTARNIVLGEGNDLCRPLTTDPFDNVLIYDAQDTATDKEGICGMPGGRVL